MTDIRLHADADHCVAPVRKLGVNQGADLKSVGRPRSQPGDRGGRTRVTDGLRRPCAYRAVCSNGGPPYFITGRPGNSGKRDMEFPAVVAVRDLTDELRQRLGNAFHR